MATPPPPKFEPWHDPEPENRQTHEARRRSAPRQEREQVLGDWFGEALAEAEIECHQQPVRSLGELLPGALQEMNLAEKVLLRRLLDQWAEIVGPDNARRCRPGMIRKGELCLEVAEAAWMFLLRQSLPELTKLVQDFSQGELRSVRLVPANRANARGRPRGRQG